MLTGIDRMMAGLGRQVVHLDQLSQNMANVSTPGFRGSDAGQTGRTFQEWMRTSEGLMENTEGPLDVALPPGDFFRVQTPFGERYSRRGDLRPDDQGRIVNGAGQVVLSEEGGELVAPEGDLYLAESGDLFSKGELVGRLGRYRVSAFEEAGGSVFTADREAEVALSAAPLRKGLLELSNVVAAAEQTRLITANARARAYQQFAVVQDQTLGGLITDVGRSRVA